MELIYDITWLGKSFQVFFSRQNEDHTILLLRSSQFNAVVDNEIIMTEAQARGLTQDIADLESKNVDFPRDGSDVIHAFTTTDIRQDSLSITKGGGLHYNMIGLDRSGDNWTKLTLGQLTKIREAIQAELGG